MAPPVVGLALLLREAAVQAPLQLVAPILELFLRANHLVEQPALAMALARQRRAWAIPPVAW